MTATTAATIEALQDALRDPEKAPYFDQDFIQEADRLLADHAIERYEVPSKNPGVYGNKGASPGQLKFQKVFFDHQFQFMCAAGSNQCLGAESFIGTHGKYRRISEITKPSYVASWDGEAIRLVWCDAPFIKGYGEIFRVYLSNGMWLDVADEHRVLCADGSWRSFCHLRPSVLLLQGSTSCSSRFRVDGPHWTRTTQDSRCCCPLCRHFDDAQLLLGEATDRFSSPSSGGEDTCIHFEYTEDATAHTRECSLESRIHHPSNQGEQVWTADHAAGVGSRASYTASQLLCERISAASRSNHESSDRSQPTCESFELASPVPLFNPYNSKQYVSIVAYESRGMQPILDITVPRHENYLAAGAIHHNSAKTVCVGGMCFSKHLRDHAQDGDIYWQISQTHEATRDIPSKTLWEFLPRSMFPKHISYQPRTGFGMIPTLHLILPNGRGRCEVNFKVEEADLKVFESSRLNGVWWTECRREAIWDALQPRLVARGGWIIADYISVAPWHKYRLRLKSGDGTPIYWQKFTMPENAHNLAEGSIETACQTMTKEQARIRVYGEEGSDRGVVYQEFDPESHVCKPFEVPWDWPRWRCFDHGYINPAACLWVAMVPAGFKFPDGIGSMWDGRIADREIALGYREFYQSELTVPQIAASIKRLSKSETYRLNGRIVADAAIFARNQSTTGKSRSIAEEFRAQGLSMKKGKKGRGADMHAQVSMVRKWFEENKILFFDTCVNTVYEHQAWRYKEKKDGDYSGSEPYVDKDDHTCLSGDTLIRTPTGDQRIDTLAGQCLPVWTPFGWQKAYCDRTSRRSETLWLKAGNREVRLTPDHEVPIVVGRCHAESLKDGSDRAFTDETGVSWQNVLLRRIAILRALGRSGSLASSRVGDGEWDDPEIPSDARPSRQWRQERQSALQLGIADSKGTHRQAHDASKAREVSGVYSSCHRSGSEVASISRREKMAQQAWERMLGWKAILEFQLQLLWKGIKNQGKPFTAEPILRPMVQESLAPVRRRYAGPTETFCLYVPGWHCFYANGTAVGNCDTLRYLLQERLTYNIPTAEMETVAE